MNFHRVAEAAVPRAAWLIDLAVAIKCFGVGCSYLIVVGDLMPEVVEQLAPCEQSPPSRPPSSSCPLPSLQAAACGTSAQAHLTP